MKYLKSFNEKFHVNSDVKHLTSIIYNKIYQLIPNLILKKEIVIENLLQDNYSRIKFKGDKITVKLGNKHGGIININVSDDDVIENLDVEFIISLSKMELSQKKLINNSVREDINHECQHIIEVYHSGDNPSKSWDFHQRLKKHESKFDNKVWIEICHLFYLAEEHELRSKVSQSLELLKNGGNLYSSDLYKKIDYLTKINPDVIISKMSTEDDFGIILVDFVKNVLLKKGNYKEVFKSYIKNINRLSKIYKRKIDKVFYFHNNPDLFLEENIDREIDYREYILDERVEKRDSKIDSILKK